MRSVAFWTVLSLAVGAVSAQTLPSHLLRRPMRSCSLPATTGIDSNFAGQRWVGGNVPFVHATSVTPAMQAAIAAAMAEIQSFANVRFVPRTNETDYVVIRDSVLNSSPVGRVGGAQILHVFNWSSRFQMVHELMHVLGFWHEHQRPDRDQFVAVQAANIDPTRAIDFEIVPTGATTRPYDLDSVMHFSGTEGGINGATTLLVLPPNTHLQPSIGQRTQISSGDRDGVRLIYGSLVPPTISSVTPQSVRSYLPGQVTLDGSLLDEATRVWFDNQIIAAFTLVSPTQIRFFVPSFSIIGQHQVQVESAAGRSASVPLTITGNDPPVLFAPGAVVRNVAYAFRIYTDNVRTNLLLAAFDNLPSVIPGVVDLGIGNQFTTLGQVGVGVGNVSGVLSINVVVPSSVPSGTMIWFQAVSFDLQNLSVPIPRTAVGATRVL